jgi:hypothetical protein
MQQRHAKDGVVCLSVSTDDVDEQANVLKFLQKQKAAFGNYLLDEPGQTWKEKLGIDGPPAVFVYGRDGKVARRFDTDNGTTFTYDQDVEAVVSRLLQPGS